MCLSTWLDKVKPCTRAVCFQFFDDNARLSFIDFHFPLPTFRQTAKQSVCFPRERVTCFVIADDERPCHCQISALYAPSFNSCNQQNCLVPRRPTRLIVANYHEFAKRKELTPLDRESYDLINFYRPTAHPPI